MLKEKSRLKRLNLPISLVFQKTENSCNVYYNAIAVKDLDNVGGDGNGNGNENRDTVEKSPPAVGHSASVVSSSEHLTAVGSRGQRRCRKQRNICRRRNVCSG